MRLFSVSNGLRGSQIPRSLVPQAAARDHPALDRVEDPFERERHDGGGHRALEDQAEVVEADAGEDRLAEAAGADQRADGGGADRDDGGGLDAGDDGRQASGSSTRRRRAPGGRPRAPAESRSGSGMPTRPGVGVADDGEQAVEEQRDERGRRADAERAG